MFGNKIGFEFRKEIDLFKPRYGSFVIELKEELRNKLEILGNTIEDKNNSI